MSKQQKLIDKLKRRSRSFTFDEAETLLLSLGFVRSNKGKTSGSRVMFVLGRINIPLHKPHPQKELMPYQIRDILDKLEEGGLI